MIKGSSCRQQHPGQLIPGSLVKTIFIAMAWLPIMGIGRATGQEIDTLELHHAVSKGDTIVFTRIVYRDTTSFVYHVQDYFENGQIQMDACYTSLDRNIKEEVQCNYHSNTKTGSYRECYRNGQIRYQANFSHGLRDGRANSWYSSGVMEAEEEWANGQLHGHVRYWSPEGALEFSSFFEHGMNQNSREVNYPYIAYTPLDYASDTLKRWPVILYLHGGSDRGRDLKKLYSQGIPDQLYRGREFPFIIIAPQCSDHLRWSTDDWFEGLYAEILAKFRMDPDRVYLTGMSLGGSGTWYLAARYPERFAAIAPISGFTSHLSFIDNHIDNLSHIPIWAFHGRMDLVVPFEETERIISKLEKKNTHIRFTAEPLAGHWIHWMVYPGKELYDWFLEHKREGQDK